MSVRSSLLALCALDLATRVCAHWYHEGGEPGIRFRSLLQQPWSRDDFKLKDCFYRYLESVVPLHKPPKTFQDYTGMYGVRALRRCYDLATGYDPATCTEQKYLQRFCFLETLAGLAPPFLPPLLVRK